MRERERGRGSERGREGARERGGSDRGRGMEREGEEETERQRKRAVLIYKTVIGISPDYIQTVMKQTSITHGRDLLSVNSLQLY